MRALMVLLSLLFSACAPSMSDLILLANNSGDWTAVSKRIDTEEAKRAEPLKCHDNFILMCDIASRIVECSCVFTDRIGNRPLAKSFQRGANRRY